MDQPGAIGTVPLDWSGFTPDGVDEGRHTLDAELRGPAALTEFPVPRTASMVDTLPAAVLESPLARMVLARARLRATMPLDVVRFTAACPSCGQDCEWTQERQDTRLRSSQSCPCAD
jgi:hypothetical protein